MVSVRHWEADKFLAASPDHIHFYLFYGPDSGLISERLRNVVRNFVDDVQDAFQVSRLEGDDLASDAGRLSDEVNSIGLFGGKRAICVRAGTRNLVPAIEVVIGSTLQDVIVLVEAGALKKESALRKLFERERSAVAIECAHDSPEQLRSVIASEARANGLAIQRETLESLAHSLGADRLTTRSELAKLMLFTHGQAEITSEDVAAVVADASNINLDAAINSAFLGQFERVDETVAQALSAGIDAGFLTGMASRHAVMLHRARLEMDRGASRDHAIERASRRAFVFTKREILAAQIDRWSTTSLARAIDLLGRSLLEIRKDTRICDVIAARAFWSVASFARRGSAR